MSLFDLNLSGCDGDCLITSSQCPRPLVGAPLAPHRSHRHINSQMLKSRLEIGKELLYRYPTDPLLPSLTARLLLVCEVCVGASRNPACRFDVEGGRLTSGG